MDVGNGRGSGVGGVQCPERTTCNRSVAGDGGRRAAGRCGGDYGINAGYGGSEVPATAPRACMIAGEFHLLGQVIRSRDCVQLAGSSTEAELQRACEGLAQTSAQMGGKAGEITYMEGCPSPSQGSCRGIFGKSFDGYYYERSADDLANLPASCAQGGGTWVAD